MISRPESHLRVAALLALVVFFQATVAAARTETLRWTEPPGQSVARFEALVGNAPGNWTTTVDLGLPNMDVNSVYTADIQVPDADDVYVAVRAIGTNGLESAPSNTQLRPGQLPDPGTQPEGSSASGPADPAAAAWIDFSGGADDWLDTRAGNSMIEDASLFSVAGLGGHPALWTASPDDDIHSHFTGDPRNTFANFTLVGRMAVDRDEAAIGVTTYSQYPSSDSYYRLGRLPNGAFRLEAHGASGFSCSDADTGVTPAAGSWYAFEIDVVNESDRNRIEARVWPAGGSRPASAQATCVDTTAGRTSGGAFGVWAAGDGEKFWDEFEVVENASSGGGGGTGNVPPEPPVLIQVQIVE